MTVAQFEACFKQLYLPLAMAALKMVDDLDEARDIVQEAFIKAWQQIDGGHDVRDMKPFMYRLVRNTAIDHLRRATARGQNVELSIDELTNLTDDSHLHETIDTAERDARVWQAIDRLPSQCREVFLLSKRDGLSIDDIATELDISPKTVKNHLTKALSRLRDSLSPTRSRPFFLPFL